MHGKVSVWWIVLLVIWLASLTTKTFCWSHCKMNFPYCSFWVLYFFFWYFENQNATRLSWPAQISHCMGFHWAGPKKLGANAWRWLRRVERLWAIFGNCTACFPLYRLFCFLCSPTRIFSFQFTDYACNKAYFE